MDVAATAKTAEQSGVLIYLLLAFSPAWSFTSSSSYAVAAVRSPAGHRVCYGLPMIAISTSGSRRCEP